MFLAEALEQQLVAEQQKREASKHMLSIEDDSKTAVDVKEQDKDKEEVDEDEAAEAAHTHIDATSIENRTADQDATPAQVPNDIPTDTCTLAHTFSARFSLSSRAFSAC